MINSSEGKSDNKIIEKATQILSKYPLCDSCLGRCFARLGYGLENKERGRAIKISLMLILDEKIKNHEIGDLSSIKRIMENLGPIAEKWYKLYFSSEFHSHPCYLCQNKIEDIKEDFSDKAFKLLSGLGVKSYVLGVELDEETKKKESKIIEEFTLMYYESIKHEIKREVGKTLSKRGYPPNMDNPEVEIVYRLSDLQVFIISKNIRTFYVYNRLNRNLPISSWFSKQGNEGLNTLLQRKIVFAFSEPTTVRILADYPIVIENEGRDKIDVGGYYIFKVMTVGKKELQAISAAKPTMRKYRVTVYSTSSLSDAIRVYGNIYDLYIDAKSFSELNEKLSKLKSQYEIIVLSVDLIDVKGRIKDIIENYLKSF
ncbi:pseudouridylate synthase [Saccharolobus solfataricus]|uniref:Pus10 THUMP domain-containing protein n=3 Tax=Saccharolobus solfataricus TaxID=2287 RepID=Q97ZE6_SACS2|nr:pseudouridylate synthase [Saccharolobus solfataricus]AAK41246.1 Conserved hypothetical protein [Saccharolobus solfataricus P2]AKA74199.1 pseudouridylate synthase [Saccharolobus solfataricus]AKA76898.1 pseudouridylate synthase [Saccharolobus solfataricus]AKA79590.1 pseudouridylate synthase [Saccharolobus solfataricus]AZF68679.1 pseudouridylate synthase [Saccharolobus solfataricus]